MRTISMGHWVWVFCVAMMPVAVRAADAPLPSVAAGHTATASSSRAKLTPDKAVDGDVKTRWSADDAKAPAWWMVDLGEARELGGCEITWERKAAYLDVVEGSLDGRTWTVLNDQRGNEEQVSVQRLLFSGAKARYVRITTAPLENSALISINEVQIYDPQTMQKLAPAVATTFVADEPFIDNIALKKPAIASSAEGSDRVASQANDGNIKTRWCAGDIGKPQWWEVDLEAVRRVGGLQIRWEKAKAYRFVLEGSSDNLEWRVLLDQRNNAADVQVQKFAFPPAEARYVRLTVTGVDDEGTWASVVELKLVEAK